MAFEAKKQIQRKTTLLGAVLFLLVSFLAPARVVFADAPPQLIHNCTELQAMQDNLAGSYKLANNIDCSGTVTWNSGKGFKPVGIGITYDQDYNEIPADPFTGSFDGAGHTISNLSILRANDIPNDSGAPEDESYVALFGATDGATIQNVHVRDSKIKGYLYVGGIIGFMTGGTLTNSSVNVTTADNSCDPGHCVWARYGTYGGGLVGYMLSGTVSNSRTAGPVKGSGTTIGGLVGDIEGGLLQDAETSSNIDGGLDIGGAIGHVNGGTVQRVSASGNVKSNIDEASGKSGRNAGGFVGSMNNGTITDSYATGKVTADYGPAGGFVATISGGTISNSYSSGKATVDGTNNIDTYYAGGGFVGTMWGNSAIQHSFAVSNVETVSSYTGGFAGYVSDVDGATVSGVYYDKYRTGKSFCYAVPRYGTANGEFSSPNAVAFDSSGNMYVADSGNNRIQKFDSSGNYLSQWGTNGTGNGEFQYPHYVAIDSSNNVYVTDTNNTRIQKFDSSGNYISQFGSVGTGNGEFQDMQGIATDGDGNVYVVDAWQGYRVQKFNSSGTFVTKWGSQGHEDGQFEYPVGIGADASNNIYVTDGNDSTVQKFTSSGTFVKKWAKSYVGSTGCTGVNPANANSTYFYDSANQPFSGNWDTDTWHFSGSSYPVLHAIDNDNDGVADSVEDLGPNGGDGNNDGILDSQQSNVASWVNTKTNEYVTLVAPEGTTITSVSNESATGDTGYSYPLGLTGFTVTGMSAGSNIDVTLYYHNSNLTPSDLTPRKYLASSQLFKDVDGATVSGVTIDDNPVIKLAYSLTDGAEFDADGAANGSITDPIGLATTSSSELAPTGQNQGQSAVFAATTIAFGFVLLVVRKRYNR